MEVHLSGYSIDSDYVARPELIGEVSDAQIQTRDLSRRTGLHQTNGVIAGTQRPHGHDLWYLAKDSFRLGVKRWHYNLV